MTVQKDSTHSSSKGRWKSQAEEEKWKWSNLEKNDHLIVIILVTWVDNFRNCGHLGWQHHFLLNRLQQLGTHLLDGIVKKVIISNPFEILYFLFIFFASGNSGLDKSSLWQSKSFTQIVNFIVNSTVTISHELPIVIKRVDLIQSEVPIFYCVGDSTVRKQIFQRFQLSVPAIPGLLLCWCLYWPWQCNNRWQQTKHSIIDKVVQN